MGMHTISVIYDPTTRRISLADSSNAYGGATTDDNSVNISVTGITADGENFAARVDFAVPIKVDNHNVIHPFVLLEQSGDEWTAVVPRAVLMATKDSRNKLPLQLVLANDNQVINSRNTIVLDVTQGIDADTDGETLPEYVVPEWEIPEGTVSEDEDVHVIEVTYDPETRMLTLDNENSKYGGATIDTRSVKIQISGIVPDGADFGARVDFAVPIMVDERRILKPFTVLENVNGVWCAMVPQAVLMAAHDIKKLPFQLVTRHGDTVINSRNTISLEITRAINAAQSTIENYAPYIMYRNDTWEWVEDFTYDTGAVVVYNGEMYTSLSDNNLGYEPGEHPEKWSLLTGVENVVLGSVEGTMVGTKIIFTSEQVFTGAGFSKNTVTVEEADVPVASVDFPPEPAPTNTGFPMGVATHVMADLPSNITILITNLDVTTGNPTKDMYLLKGDMSDTSMSNFETLAVIRYADVTNEVKQAPVISSDSAVAIWEVDGTLSPKSAHLTLYEFDLNTVSSHTVVYGDTVGSFAAMISHDGGLQISITDTNGRTYETAYGYNEYTYIWHPEEEYDAVIPKPNERTTIHWVFGEALIFDNGGMWHLLADDGTIMASTARDNGEDSSFMAKIILDMFPECSVDSGVFGATVDDDGIMTADVKLGVGVVPTGGLPPSSDMPNGCMLLADITDENEDSYRIYIGTCIYIIPHEAVASNDG